MKQFLLFVLIVSLNSIASAQLFKGTVSSVSGDPIPYSTVYIRETTTGIVCDEQGRFQTRLAPGVYTCEFRSLGYVSQTKTVEMDARGSSINVQLAVKEQKINEITVRPGKEDPAYNVMRQAIAKAPYHLYQVSTFSSDNYLKGSAKIESIPTLMKMMIKDQKLKSLIGKLLVLESQNQINFQSPGKYTQHVIAYKSSIPKDMEPKGGIRISTSSIYGAKFDGSISPLSPQAFRYYQFKLMDISANGKYQVNKIRITPKLKNDELFSGDIYILENDWSVFSLDLSTTDMGTTTRYKVNYQEVQPTVFMPITYDMYTNIGTMGVKGYARFYSSVKYKNLKLNPTVANVQAQIKPTTPETKKQAKALAKIQQLSAKEKLSTRDALKIARLMTAAVEPRELKEKRDSLEIKDVDPVQMEIDSMASKRDSTFWEDIRNVPLQADEAASFHRRDSLSASESVKTTNGSVSITLGKTSNKNGWLMGTTVPLNKHLNLYYSGLLHGVLKEYNFVDGMWLGQKLSLAVDSNLNITPSAYYTTARKSVVWNVTGVYRYAPLAGGQLQMWAGNSSQDIQGDKGTSRFLNSLSSLFAGDNVIRFYQNKYFKIENQIDIANGLQLTAGAAYENRQLLTNNTDFHIWGKTPRPNSPDIAYSNAFPANTTTTAWGKLEYTPFYKYSIRNGKKEYVKSAYPTFGAEYKKAFAAFGGAEQASYDRIKLSVSQNIRLSEFDKLNYHINVGSYLTKQKLYAPDYNYFQTSPLPVTFNLFDNSFALLDNYTYSNNRWLESHINWTSDYLLLKRISFLQSTSFSESLQLNTLWNVSNEKPYIEVGYSIGLWNLSRLSIFAGFDGLTYKNMGLKLSLPLFVGIGR